MLLETTDRAEMADRVTAYIAHRLIDRQRQIVEPAGDLAPARRTFGRGALVVAGLSGFGLGILLVVLIIRLLA
jgi:hypothetical protein